MLYPFKIIIITSKIVYAISAIARPRLEDQRASLADFIFSSLPADVTYLMPEITIKISEIIPTIDNKYLIINIIASEIVEAPILLQKIPKAGPQVAWAKTVETFIIKICAESKQKHNVKNSDKDKFLYNGFLLFVIIVKW